MGRKGRKRIIKIPKAQDLGPLKEVETIKKKKEEEIKLIEEEKYRQEEMELRKQKQIQDDIIRREEEAQKVKEKERMLAEEKALKEAKLKEDIVDIPEGFYKREIYTGQDDDNEGMVIKYSGEKPDEFLYKVQPSDFQKSLKEFFKDVPIEDSDEEELLPVPSVKSLDESGENKKEQAETVEDFNLKVKKTMIDRNKLMAPQAYKLEQPKPKEKVIDLEKRVDIIKNTSVKNKNLTLISRRRSNNPVSRVNNKISNNRML